jgi:cytochrome c556
MNKKVLAAGLAFALGAGYTLSAFSQAKPEVLVEQRRAVMTLHGKYMYSITPMASGKIPYNADIVARNANFLSVLAQMPWDGFEARTADVKPTRAMQEIYKDAAGFKAKQDAYLAEIPKLLAAVKGGNETAIKAAINDTNKACNSCHDSFRSKQ